MAIGNDGGISDVWILTIDNFEWLTFHIMGKFRFN